MISPLVPVGPLQSCWRTTCICCLVTRQMGTPTRCIVSTSSPGPGSTAAAHSITGTTPHLGINWLSGIITTGGRKQGIETVYLLNCWKKCSLCWIHFWKYKNIFAFSIIYQWWHQAITWTSVDFPSKVFCFIHLKVVLQNVLKMLIHKISLKITLLKLQPHLLWANEIKFISLIRFRW